MQSVSVRGALEASEKKTGSDPVATLKKAMDKYCSLEVRSSPLAVQPTRFRLRFAPGRSTALVSAGSSASPSSAARRP